MINNRYEIIEKIGEGRSSVFLCYDKESFNKKIALKIFSNSQDLAELASFRNEFLHLKNLEHPSIINAIEEGTVLESNDANISIGSKFFTLEYFSGKDLLSVNKYSEKDLLEIIIQISSVLFYLHQSNFIYYDLKPENILISYSNGIPHIKLIDFGLARYVSEMKENYIFGTAEYIAPELLRKETHDYRVDLYSFGILIYRLIYNSFPFDRNNEIEIYKAHLEKIFEFPDSGYSPQLISIVKKLLSKNPEDRYLNSAQIIGEIDVSLLKNISKSWSPAKIFVDREDIYTALVSYLEDKTSSEIFAIKGPEGSGKSFLLDRIHAEFDEAVLLTYTKAKSGLDFIKELLLRILYNQIIFNSIPFELKSKIKQLIINPPEDIIDQINAVFSKISQTCNFFLLFDNFNEIDELTHAVIKNIIPILQVNKRKFILAEDSFIPSLSPGIYELREFNLTSFSEPELNEYLEKSYFKEFPKEELRKVILQFADLLPGNIKGFIKDILLLGILEYDSGGIKVASGKNSKKLLQSSHEEIYGLRISSISLAETSAAQLISLFDISIDQAAAAVLLDISPQDMEIIVSGLLQKNIILPPHLSNTLNFTSAGLKNYIYTHIIDKKNLHYKTAHKIQSSISGFNAVELARQFELSAEFNESYNVIKEELTAAEKISAYSYKKKLLQKYLGFPFGNEIKSEIKQDLVSVLYNLSEFGNAVELIDDLLTEKLRDGVNDELLLLKGSCLIGIGKIEAGKNLLINLINKIEDNAKRIKLLVEVANAEYELSNFSETVKICTKIINDNMTDGIEKGKCYSLLGHISIFTENNLTNALYYLELAENFYKEKGLNYKVAQMQTNIGNIYNIKGDHGRAEEYWNKSLEITLSIGNLELEAKLLLSYGIYYFDELNFEKAFENYNRALSIFVSLGNSSGEGLVQYNLAEIYLFTCEYEKSIEAIDKSIKIFQNIKNLNEEMESLFLLGKLYFTICDLQDLNIVIQELKEKMEDEKIVEKHKLNCNLLSQLYSISNGDFYEAENTFRVIKGQYLEQEDKINYFFVSSQLIKLLIQNGNYEEVLSELEDKSFIKICSENKLYNAERNYLFAVLTINNKAFGNPVDYLLKALNYINESSITELSWKVLYQLADIYFERGNYPKSEEYNTFALSVLNYIFNNINNKKIQSYVIESSERREVYQKLLMMQKNY
ncbi:MAG: protein kinase [Ignavibacteriaceae bacterium]|nr:protein kinase [Ignavibacteriaceae bacterium]